MADESKGLEAGGTGADRPSGEPVIADTAAPAPPTRSTPATEWTASDARGPLGEAPPLAIGGEAEHEAGVSSPHDLPSDEARFETGTSEASEAGRPASAMSEAVTPEPVKPPRRSLLPVAAAVLVGAIIGAGSAYFVYQSQHAANDGLDRTVAHLSERVDALDKRPDPQPAITALKSSVATLDGKVAALQKAAAAAPLAPVASASTPAPAASSAKPTAASASAPSSPPPSIAPSSAAPSAAAPPAVVPASAPQAAPAFDPAPLQQKIAALQATIDGLQKQAADAKALALTVGAIQVSVDGLKSKTAEVQKQTSDVQKQTSEVQKQASEMQKQTSEVQKQTSDVQKQTAEVQKQASGAQAGIEAIQGQQKSFEGRISAPALAVVADSLVQQINQGQPYTQQVDALATLGADPARIAILRENARKGVPSSLALAAQFKPLAEPILATEHKVAVNASLLDRLKSGMSGLVSVRKTSDTTGDGLEARVSRIEADLTHDDVAGAYATWNGLPPDAKAKSDAWGALAKTAAEAIDAARGLQQAAIASLGGRKS